MTKNVFRTIGVLFVVTASVLLVSCQEDGITPDLFGSISGTVLDGETNVPISSANVTTSPPTNSIVTDASGKFTMGDVPIGNYSIIVQKSGYGKNTVTIAVKEDQTTNAIVFLERTSVVNNPPTVPEKPSPADQAANQMTSLTLRWVSTDPDSIDLLTFDIYLYESSSPVSQLLAKDHPDTSIEVSNLKYNTSYFWQVVAKDTNGAVVNGPVWSFQTRPFPDNPIVFTTNRDGNYEIYSSDIEGNVIRLTYNQVRDWNPRLNPAKTRIAYTSENSGGPQIYTMNRDGSGQVKITTLPVTGFHNFGIGFCWSPDGGSLIYAHYEKLYRIDANGANLTLIATAPPGRHFREVEWSPAGNKIAAVTIGSNIFDGEIYIMNPDGSDFTLLVPDQPGVISSLSFSLDGTKMLYTRDISGFNDPSGVQLNARVFMINIDGTGLTDLSEEKPTGTNDLNPRFSPTGASIIFTNQPNDMSKPKDIYTMDLEGKNRTLIITNGDMPDWR